MEDAEGVMSNIHELSGCGGRDRMRFMSKSLKLYFAGNKSELIGKTTLAVFVKQRTFITKSFLSIIVLISNVCVNCEKNLILGIM